MIKLKQTKSGILIPASMILNINTIQFPNPEINQLEFCLAADCGTFQECDCDDCLFSVKNRVEFNILNQ